MFCASIQICSALIGRLHNLPRPLALSAQLAALLVVCEITSPSQQLSLQRYDASDGLAHGEVTSIYQDTKGYLWLSTFGGLSRFDGYRFINYGVLDGLPHIIVNDVRQDHRGRLWVATNGGGVALLNEEAPDAFIRRVPSARAGDKFITFLLSDAPAANKVNRMLFDSHKALWCVTDFGIYRAQVSEPTLHFEPIIVRHSPDSAAMIEDSQKRLWFGLADELIEVSEDQTVHRITNVKANGESIRGIVEAGPNRLFIATSRGLFEYLPDLFLKGRGSWRKLSLTLDAGQEILTLLKNRAGTLWLGTNKALVKYQDGQQVAYKTAQGLDVPNTRSLAEDRDDNLWIGTVGGGVFKLINETVVSYTRANGLPHSSVSRVFEDDAGGINAVMNLNVDVFRINDASITANQKVKLVPQASSFLFVRQREDHSWEISTLNAQLRLREPMVRLRDGRKINVKNLAAPQYWKTGFQVLEDESETLWLFTRGGTIHRTAQPRSLILENIATDFLSPRSIMSDRQGGIWLGEVGKLGRIRQGQFRLMQPTDGLPETDPRSIFVDSRGWLWVGDRYKGVSVTQEPAAEQPRFINYSPEQNLASGDVWSIAEDDFGRMYFGTTKGLDRFDPQTNQWLRYTREDGLPSNYISHLFKDRRGCIWVSTLLGVARINPRAERRAKTSLSVYLSHVQIAGEDLILPETGAAHIEQLDLPAARNNLLLEYVAPSFQNAEALRYQYMLEGVDADFSAPANQRSVNYARLAPGDYRFLVRAVNADGSASEARASFSFTILSPIWRRWWFIAIAAALIGSIAYALYRYRVARLVELERVRTRIAADLHDDIGSSLSQISVLSEVLRKQLGAQEAAASRNLLLINRVSQEALDSMSDIVWAINPLQDHLSDLARRMRRVASEVLPARDIEFTFNAPTTGLDLRLGADIRREVFLMFKETLNNLVRHSECTQAEIELRIERASLVLVVADDGKGFEPHETSEGNGLVSLRRRARSLGGETVVSSHPGKGATVTIRVPHSHHKRLRGSNGRP